MLVKDIYNPNVYPMKDTQTVKESLAIFVEKNINSAIVLDKHDKLVGILSLPDVAAAIVPDEMRENPNLASALYKSGFFGEVAHKVGSKKIVDIMRKDIQTVTLETSVLEISSLFLKNDLYLIPVMQNGKVIGVVTRSEIKKALFEGME